jgi:hypothetical protein
MFETLKNLWNYMFGEETPKKCCQQDIGLDCGPKMQWWEVTQTDYDKLEFTSQSIGTINYLVNDPSTPDLVIRNYEIPDPPVNPKFTVSGIDLPAMKSQSLNVYATISRSLNYIQRIVSQTRAPIGSWSGQNPLPVVTRAGKDWNAFYDRASLKFFYGTDPTTNNLVFMCNSADVVAHELGHALLDSLRPDFWSVQNVEIWAFHESFGDIVAMLTMMQSDEVINRAVQETNSDLSKSNVITRLAEEMGTGLYHATNGRGGNVGFLRDASIRFDYVNPAALPGNAPSGGLSSECHSFSRVFTSAWYNMFVRIYKKELSKGNTVLDAAKTARDACASYLFKAIVLVPKTAAFFNALAKAIAAADKAAGSPYAEQVIGTLSDRKIYVPMVGILAEEAAPKPHKTLVMKLSDHVVSSMGVVHNPIYDLEIEVAADDGEDSEIVNSAQLAADHIYSKNDYNHNKAGWESQDGKLVRRHVCRWH